MASFNWIDIIILLLLASAIYGGIKIGFLTLLLTFGGFFGSFFILGWILPHLLPVHKSLAWVVINANLLFIFSIYAGFRGYDYGSKLHHSFKKGKGHAIESAAGLTLSLSSAVIAVWLIAAAIGSMPFVGLSNTVADSYFVQLFSRNLPAAPAVFQQFSTLVNPNIDSEVYIKNQPNSSIGSAPLPAVTTAVEKAGQSIVRITGFGCSDIVSGSGFVVAPGVIATNAHVIAGVKRPIIKYGLRSYSAKAILYDANLDFALLKVNGFSLPALKLDTESLTKGTLVDTIGYPGNIYTVNGGVLEDSLPISGPNIYAQGTVIRNIYVIHSPIAAGLSGGPVVLNDGQVVGMIFADSQTTKDHGYDLTTAGINGDIITAENNQATVSTGTCIKN